MLCFSVDFCQLLLFFANVVLLLYQFCGIIMLCKLERCFVLEFLVCKSNENCFQFEFLFCKGGCYENGCKRD